MPRVVVVVGDLVPGDHGAGCERVELVERVDPFQSRLRVGLGEAGMDAVVDHVAGRDQPDRCNSTRQWGAALDAVMPWATLDERRLRTSTLCSLRVSVAPVKTPAGAPVGSRVPPTLAARARRAQPQTRWLARD